MYLFLVIVYFSISLLMLYIVTTRTGYSYYKLFGYHTTQDIKQKRFEDDLRTAIIWPMFAFTRGGRSKIANALS